MDNKFFKYLPPWLRDPDPDQWLLTDNYLVLDFEGTNLEKGSALVDDNRILLACWRYKGVSKAVWGDVHDMGDLLADIEEADLVVAHNAKFELQWLKRAGARLQDMLTYDTMLGEYVLYGNQKVPLNLGAIASRYGLGGKEAFVDKMMRAGVCPSMLPRSLLLDRCRKDVLQTEEIFLQQRQVLKDTDRLKTVFTRNILTAPLADIEFNGMCLSADRVREEYNDAVKRTTEIGRKLDEMAGGINLNSPVQLGEFVYGTLEFEELKSKRGEPLRTPSGGRKTDSDTLSALKAKTKQQKEFVSLWSEYNKLTSALSKNLEFFKGVVEESEGGIFHGQFNQAVTATHRLSASGRPIKFEMFKKKKSVQFQNMPRAYKRLFKSRNDGWLVGEADGGQLEFRVAGFLGADKAAVDAIADKFDVHTFTSETLTANGEPTGRQDAKAHTFKPLYGGQSGTKAQQAYYQAFKARYPGITSWQENNKREVLRTKQLRIPSGLIFYWPDTKLRDDYITNSTSICNYPVQSFATADIIPIAIASLWHIMKRADMQSFIVNTVHDSTIMELHPDEVEPIGEISGFSFTDYVYFYLEEVYDVKFFVNLAAGYKVGEHWSEGEEIVFEKYPKHKLEDLIHEESTSKVEVPQGHRGTVRRRTMVQRN